MHFHLSAVDLGYYLPDGSTLFQSLTFSFNMVRTGLIGQNGVGKTTLLDILAGKKPPTFGSVSRVGRIAYLAQAEPDKAGVTVAEVFGFASEMEAHERIAQGEGALKDFELIENLWDLPERVEAVFQRLAIAHIGVKQPAASISGGERTRVRIAGLLLQEPDFLLLDEPTNHLDFSGREFIYEFIASWKRGLVVVSHDRTLLSLVDQIAELDRGCLQFYGGNFDFYRGQRQIERAAAEQAFVSAKLKLKRAQAIARQAAERQERRASAGRKRVFKTGISPMFAGNLKRDAENTTSRVKDRHQKKIGEATRELHLARDRRPEENHIIVDLERTVVPSGKRMIELEGVNYRYPNADRPLWGRPVDFSILGGERLSLEGPNGSGKSTLIGIITGSKAPSVGAVKTGTSRIGLLGQGVEVLDPALSVFDNLKRVAPLRQEHDLRILLGRFLFYKDSVFKPASVLSGGERMRAGLACLLGADQAPELLILDEPTNNLDLQSIEAVASAIKNYHGTLIVVSHDRVFLDEIEVERSIRLDI